MLMLEYCPHHPSKYLCIKHAWLSICVMTVFLFYPSHFMSVSFVSFGIYFPHWSKGLLKGMKRKESPPESS